MRQATLGAARDARVRAVAACADSEVLIRGDKLTYRLSERYADHNPQPDAATLDWSALEVIRGNAQRIQPQGARGDR